MFECVPAGYVVYEEGPGSATVVGSGYGTEGFLSGCVPYLKLDGFVSNINHTCAKLDSNSKIMDGLETFVGELEEEARFANSCEGVNGGQYGEIGV